MYLPMPPSWPEVYIFILINNLSILHLNLFFKRNYREMGIVLRINSGNWLPSISWLSLQRSFNKYKGDTQSPLWNLAPKCVYLGTMIEHVKLRLG